MAGRSINAGGSCVSLEDLDFDNLRAPAGLNCYPLSWYPRVKHAGVYKGP